MQRVETLRDETTLQSEKELPMALIVTLTNGEKRKKGKRHHDVRRIDLEVEDEQHMEGNYCTDRDGAAGWEEAGCSTDDKNEDAKAVEYCKQGKEQARTRELEKDKAVLEAELDCLKWDTLQQAICISQLEYALGSLSDEHDGLKHAHNVYKAKETTTIHEKDCHISDLKDKVCAPEKQLEKHLDEPQ